MNNTIDEDKNSSKEEVVELANKAISLAEEGLYSDAFKLFKQAWDLAIELQKKGVVDNLTIEWIYHNLEVLSYKMHPPSA